MIWTTTTTTYIYWLWVLHRMASWCAMSTVIQGPSLRGALILGFNHLHYSEIINNFIFEICILWSQMNKGACAKVSGTQLNCLSASHRLSASHLLSASPPTGSQPLTAPHSSAQDNAQPLCPHTTTIRLFSSGHKEERGQVHCLGVGHSMAVIVPNLGRQPHGHSCAGDRFLPLLMQVLSELLWRGYNLSAVGRTAGPWGRERPNLTSLPPADSLQEGQPDSQWAMDRCQVTGRGPQASVRAYRWSPSNYPVLRTTEERINVDISVPLVALPSPRFLNKGPAFSFCIEPCKLCSHSCSF